jgi:hypothetical protein
MKKTKYNFWLAVSYEIVKALSEQFPKLKRNKIIILLLDYCKCDWIIWRIETALDAVDKQIDDIHKKWEEHEKPKFTYIEHQPDGSNAQNLLGGAIEIRSNFQRD